MVARTYWNLRKQSGHKTRIPDGELNELNWRALRTLLVHFEDNIDSATDKLYVSNVVSDLGTDNETFGKIITQACLYATAEVYDISELEELNENSESARKSNMYYEMFKEVWNEVIGIRDAPIASSKSAEAIKENLAHHLHSLLFGTRAKIEHHFDRREININSLQQLLENYHRIQRGYAKLRVRVNINSQFSGAQASPAQQGERSANSWLFK